jgi:Fe-S oxidoreductase
MCFEFHVRAGYAQAPNRRPRVMQQCVGLLQVVEVGRSAHCSGLSYYRQGRYSTLKNHGEQAVEQGEVAHGVYES